MRWHRGEAAFLLWLRKESVREWETLVEGCYANQRRGSRKRLAERFTCHRRRCSTTPRHQVSSCPPQSASVLCLSCEQRRLLPLPLPRGTHGRPPPHGSCAAAALLPQGCARTLLSRVLRGLHIELPPPASSCSKRGSKNLPCRGRLSVCGASRGAWNATQTSSPSLLGFSSFRVRLGGAEPDAAVRAPPSPPSAGLLRSADLADGDLPATFGSVNTSAPVVLFRFAVPRSAWTSSGSRSLNTLPLTTTDTNDGCTSASMSAVDR